MLFVDLDQFKRINDTLGHDMGDLLLQEVAKRLVSCVRRSDAIFSEGRSVACRKQVESKRSLALAATSSC